MKFNTIVGSRVALPRVLGLSCVAETTIHVEGAQDVKMFQGSEKCTMKTSSALKDRQVGRTVANALKTPKTMSSVARLSVTP